MNYKYKILFYFLFISTIIFIACNKNNLDISKSQNEIISLSEWVKTNGNIIVNNSIIVYHNNLQKVEYLDWNKTYRIETKNNIFYEIPFITPEALSSNSTLGSSNSHTVLPNYTLVIQKRKKDGLLIGRIQAKILNVNNSLSENISSLSFYSDLNGRKTSTYAETKSISKLQRVYEYSPNYNSISSNSTFQIKPNSCVSFFAPIWEYMCTGSSSTGNYNVTCGYHEAGVRYYSFCSNETPNSVDEFNYEDYNSSWDQLGTIPINPNEDIIDSLNGYPCAQAALREMVGCNAFTKLILKDVFGVDVQTNIKFSVNPNLNDTVVGQARVSNGSMVSYMAEIELNPKYLNGSQDYIASTLIHEAIHSYIDFKRRDLGSDTTTFSNMFPVYWSFRQNEAQHNEMANNYVNKMANFLKQFNVNLSDETAIALAWGGLGKTALWKSKSSGFKDSVELINRKCIKPTSDDVTELRLKKCN